MNATTLIASSATSTQIKRRITSALDLNGIGEADDANLAAIVGHADDEVVEVQRAAPNARAGDVAHTLERVLESFAIAPVLSAAFVRRVDVIVEMEKIPGHDAHTPAPGSCSRPWRSARRVWPNPERKCPRRGTNRT
jgi:hypothetical protein